MIIATDINTEGKVRYAVLGLGIGMAHVTAAAGSEKAVLVAVADINEDRRKTFSADYPTVPTYTSLEEMIEKSAPDIVSICLPTGMHADYAVRAMRMGCGVLVEKPLDVTPEKAQAILDTAQETGKICGVVFQNRYNYGLDPIYEALSNGRLGKPLLGTFAVKWHRDDAYFAANGGWRGTWEYDGGGSLMNQSIHTVDLMLQLLGKPTSITSHIRTRAHSIETEDITVSTLTFESGAVASFVSTTCAYPGVCTEISLTCEGGSVALEADKLVLWKLRDSTPDEEAEVLARYGVGNRKAARVCRGRHFGHKRIVEDICTAFLVGTAPAITPNDAMLPLRVVCAAYESARSGKTVYFNN